MKRLLLCVLMMAFGILPIGNSSVHPAENIVRLHVIANSDSAYDQSVKLLVRDAILCEYGNAWGSMDSGESALTQISSQQEDIAVFATRVLTALGADYQASAQTGVFPFPNKDYDGLVYPAGDYNALRVVLGDGQGKNWWCVLYPPLCLEDSPAYDAQVIDGVTGAYVWNAEDLIALREKTEDKVVLRSLMADFIAKNLGIIPPRWELILE